MSMRPVPVACAELSALALLALLPRPAAAAWPTDPTVNVPLSVAAGRQGYPEAAPDASGGAIVAWDDQRSGPRDIYVQRVDGTGAPRWTTDGVPICTAAGEQYEPEVVTDGGGGAIVTWSDWRGTAFDIYAQRVDSAGTPQWTTDGVAICTAANFQSRPAIVADGSGGAIVTWEDARTGNDRIYAQRVNGSGVPQWTANGVVLTNSAAGQAFPVIVSNGAGGAIVAWLDYRAGEADVYAQRVLSNGVVDPAWPAGGRAVAVFGGDQEGVVMAPDGSGGAFVAWAQFNGGTRDVHIQHVLASGALDPLWPANGRVLMAGDFYDQSSPAIVADGAGGAIVAVEDATGASRDIRAHHVLASGALDPGWPATGLSLCTAAGEQWAPRAVSDGTGGALVSWWDRRSDDGDIYVQHVTGAGTVDPAWPADGRALSTAGLLQLLPVIVGDGAGGAVVAWEDRRSAGKGGEDSDIYAQRVKANGQLGEDPVQVPDAAQLAFALEAPSPNPTRAGTMIVRFTLPGAATASLELFDVAGRRIAAREVGSFGAGHHAVDLTAGRRPAAGVYFLRLLQGDIARVQRIVVLD